ncbi:hypothetical protein SAMN05216410_1791 [Sanguibacter gelidistatuariae]|uniref:Uncharacterized protein n=1 Tax=Sanguibacter gelidistatuariae TaxID=1814289 RepID=A0A1G6L8Q0_9MICO|nr:hypothetical protein [Sanguibacter gelidistatuariae]SDC39513.1 hypothetical protein SAMN05216410_1791 [Sanguibacter gelidistatuariae]
MTVIPHEFPATPVARLSRRQLLIAIAVAVMVAAGVLFVVKQAMRPSALEYAYEVCKLSSSSGARLADAGSTLILDTQGEDDLTGMDYLDLYCVSAALDMPTSVMTQIEQTRAMDGRVSGTWDGLSASWSYHPDSGLDLMVTAE